MGDEIERKWLVSKIPEDLLSKNNFFEIDQGYFEVSKPDKEEIRIRSEGNRYFLVIKKGKGVQREESDVEIPLITYNKLSFLPEHWIKKTRYKIPDGRYTIELDVYKGNLEGLVTAEVEFSNIDEERTYHPPDWFGQEITYNECYKNKNLAKEGIPK